MIMGLWDRVMCNLRDGMQPISSLLKEKAWHSSLSISYLASCWVSVMWSMFTGGSHTCGCLSFLLLGYVTMGHGSPFSDLSSSGFSLGWATAEYTVFTDSKNPTILCCSKKILWSVILSMGMGTYITFLSRTCTSTSLRTRSY